MPAPTKVVVDLSRPKGQRESIIELTAAEIDERAIQAAEAAAEALVQASEAQAKADVRASGVAKLEALGLTSAEISALTA